MIRDKLSGIKQTVSIATIPDGEYSGIRGGYVVKFSTPLGEFEGTTENGIRGFNIPCIVVVKHGEVTVK